MGKTTWTDDRVELLKSLWGAGKTAAEIAKELGEGLTRNAVIGKAHRLGLSGRITPVAKKIDKPLPPETTNISAKDGGTSLLELTEQTCRYPYGDPKKEGFHFCALNMQKSHTKQHHVKCLLMKMLITIQSKKMTLWQN
jgi:GcrA cell cycle regulator